MSDCPKCGENMEQTSYIETSQSANSAYSGYFSHGIALIQCGKCGYAKIVQANGGRVE
jgi:hypothetical protein